MPEVSSSVPPARWAVFLDRDGVLAEARVVDGIAFSPRTEQEFHLTSGARQAVEALKSSGAFLVVVTNQPDLARGDLSVAQLHAMHAQLCRELPVDHILVCPHEGSERCECRKPAPGMLFEAARRFGIDLAASWMIGDRWVDVAAGKAAGTRTVLVETPYSWRPTSAGAPSPELSPDCRVHTVGEAAAAIIDQSIASPPRSATAASSGGRLEDHGQ